MMDSYPEVFLALNDQMRAHGFELIRSSMHSDAIHSRHRRTELDGNRLNPDYTTSIYFGRCWTTTVKYLWLSRVDGRGRAPGYNFELVYSKRIQVGQYLDLRPSLRKHR
jgi:hypothetical protein